MWDSSKTDLTIHRATRPDIERRKASTRSHNANQARAELEERQQRMAVGDFSQVFEGLEATTPSDRTRPLDYESPRTAERPKDSDASMHVESIHAQLDALGQPVKLFAAEGAAPPPPPNLSGRAPDAAGDPVVDLDREIELFKLRAGARLQVPNPNPNPKLQGVATQVPSPKPKPNPKPSPKPKRNPKPKA